MSGSLVTNARSLIDRNRNGTLGPIGIDKFPDDIEAVPHKMVITIRSRSYNNGGSTLSDNVLTGSNISKAVVLPVPVNIEERYSASYNATDLGNIGNAIAVAAREIKDAPNSIQSASGAIARLTTAVNNVTEPSNLSDIMGAALYSSAINLTSQALRRGNFNTPVAASIAAGTGLIYNPHQTALFTGVNIRVLQYNWTLAPKTEKESRSVENIVRVLRNAMLPKRSTNSLFLEFPNEIEYKILGPSQEFSMPTVPCVITQLSLNRTGSGEPAFFAKTGAPAVYRLNIELMEIKALLRDDFEDISGQYGTTTNPGD